MELGCEMSREHTICCPFRPQFPGIFPAPSKRKKKWCKNKSAERMMTKKNAAQSNESTRREQSNLDSRYGAIGISAVAAALPYRNEPKQAAYAASDNELDKWIAESAAA
jgi:hypothetical protein